MTCVPVQGLFFQVIPTKFSEEGNVTSAAVTFSVNQPSCRLFFQKNFIFPLAVRQKRCNWPLIKASGPRVLSSFYFQGERTSLGHVGSAFELEMTGAFWGQNQ